MVVVDRTGLISFSCRSELSAAVRVMVQSDTATVDQPVRVKVIELPGWIVVIVLGVEVTASQWLSSGTQGVMPRSAFRLDQLRCTVQGPAKMGASASHRSAHSCPLARNHRSSLG